MIAGTNLQQATETAQRRPAVTLPPKRRSKFAADRRGQESLPAPVLPVFSRPPRMKRSGPMSLQWRSGSDDQRTNTIRISPEILSAFNNAFGALRKASSKQAIHAAA
jgi:hypothetical protein